MEKTVLANMDRRLDKQLAARLRHETANIGRCIIQMLQRKGDHCPTTVSPVVPQVELSLVIDRTRSAMFITSPIRCGLSHGIILEISGCRSEFR